MKGDGGEQTDPLPLQEKLPSKSPALLGLNLETEFPALKLTQNCCINIKNIKISLH